MSPSLLNSLHFDPQPVGKKAPDRYLIIGFDTEYQRYIDAEHKRLENEVLSYQFSCVVVERDPTVQGIHWSGLVTPSGPNVSDRLTLLEFIDEAIRSGIKEHPKAVLPRSIYLVAHFTRADVPGFRDFKETETRANLKLQNIRNLFMNVANDIDVNLDSGDPKEPIALKIKIRDTLSLAPGGARSLAAIGDILGFEKIKVGETPADELSIKKNMKAFMARDWDLFRAYAIRDAEICAEYALRMIRLYQEKTGKFRMPVTLTSIGVDMITRYWRDQGVSSLEIVGKEKVSQKYWSKRHSRYQTKQKITPIKKLFWHEDFFTECYHGGRNEQFWFGPAFEGRWYDYDLSSAYPSAMALIGRPNWQKLHVIRDTEELLNTYIAADLVYANIEFEFPDDVRFPVLPVRTENGLIFPRKGNCSTHISEILLAKSLGAKISLIEGRYIPSARHGNWAQGIDRPKRPFEGFTKYCIDERSKHPKKSLENLFWKELVNSTYGKTAQGLRERRVYDLRDMGTKKLEPSKITNPVYAAFITAFCRGVLGEIMNRLPEGVAIFSVTTDGFLTTATDDQMREAASGTLSKYYMSSRQKLTGDESVYEVKHIIRQPLGWRTRAQATLIESHQNDWQETGITPKEDDLLVLAKGGIRLPDRASKAVENAQIVELFFNRSPTDKLSMTLGAGIREMYEGGIDFVDKELDRSLSMEFDWKRKPYAVGETQGVTSSGRSYQHLFFSTTPWESVDQFNKTREIWEQYNQTQRHCLKSKSDYDLFASFLESKLSAEGPVGAYLRRENGDLKRLRQQLIIAWALRKAGTHTLKPHAFKRTNIFPTYRLKAKELASLINDDLGLPCSKTDVDNAKKKKVFTPHQVPNTEATRIKLGMIKRHLFPELEVDQFLSGQAAFSLDPVAVDQCPLANQMVIQD